MFNVLSLSNVVALAIIVVFWARVFAHARVARGRIPAILMIFPMTFGLAAYLINNYHAWWGTIGVAAVHVFLAVRLLRGSGRAG